MMNAVPLSQSRSSHGEHVSNGDPVGLYPFHGGQPPLHVVVGMTKPFHLGQKWLLWNKLDCWGWKEAVGNLHDRPSGGWFLRPWDDMILLDMLYGCVPQHSTAQTTLTSWLGGTSNGCSNGPFMIFLPVRCFDTTHSCRNMSGANWLSCLKLAKVWPALGKRDW